MVGVFDGVLVGVEVLVIVRLGVGGFVVAEETGISKIIVEISGLPTVSVGFWENGIQLIKFIMKVRHIAAETNFEFLILDFPCVISPLGDN